MGTRICNPKAVQQLGTENLQPFSRATVGDRESATPHSMATVGDRINSAPHSRATVWDRESAILQQGISWGQRICNPTAGHQLGTENLQALSRATVGDRETATLQQGYSWGQRNCKPTAGQHLANYRKSATLQHGSN